MPDPVPCAMRGLRLELERGVKDGVPSASKPGLEAEGTEVLVQRPGGADVSQKLRLRCCKPV
jgi:hypothetical protein